MNLHSLFKRFQVQAAAIALLISLSYPVHVEGAKSKSKGPRPEHIAAPSEKQKSRLSEWIAFLKAAYKNRASMGAIAPSSSFLARAITTCIDKEMHGKRVIEIGAGTGVFTEEIIKMLHPDDHLIVIEFDEDLCKILNTKFGHLKNVHIYCCSILDWPKHPYYDKKGYDFIISGLPLNSFEPSFVEQVLKVYDQLLRPDGHIAYFEYIVLPTIKQWYLWLADEDAAEAFDEVLSRKEKFTCCFEYVEKERVIPNWPPARVVHCCGRKST